MQTTEKAEGAHGGGMDPHRDLLAYRQDFPIVVNKTFLNTCSLGALSVRTTSNIQEYLSLWAEYGASAWYKLWLGKCAELRAAYGRVVGAPEERIALGPSISSAKRSSPPTSTSPLWATAYSPNGATASKWSSFAAPTR
jgi:kynureninase